MTTLRSMCAASVAATVCLWRSSPALSEAKARRHGSEEYLPQIAGGDLREEPPQAMKRLEVVDHLLGLAYGLRDHIGKIRRQRVLVVALIAPLA